MLAVDGYFVLDGGLATELEKRGHNLNHPLWSGKILKEDPQSIKEVHLDYFLAGANFATTASYQTSSQGLRDHLGLDEDQAVELIIRSVRLAQAAIDEALRHIDDRKLAVAGSVGPYGAYLSDGSEYTGHYGTHVIDFKAFHRPRIQALVDAGVDLLAIETMPNVVEIQEVLDLLASEFPSATAWLSCTLADSQHISDGTKLEAVLSLLSRHEEQILAFGVNCVNPDLASAALKHMQGLTSLPLVCYPNSGEDWDAVTKTWSSKLGARTSIKEQVQGWHASGAKFTGGCCRTGPEYIKAVSAALSGEV